MVERPLSMREAPGSIPGSSTFLLRMIINFTDQFLEMAALKLAYNFSISWSRVLISSLSLRSLVSLLFLVSELPKPTLFENLTLLKSIL